MLSMLWRALYFLVQIFNFLVSKFWCPELFVPRAFVAGTFWRCNILPLKNKNLPLLYETRATFSYKLCCRKFCYRKLTWNRFSSAVGDITKKAWPKILTTERETKVGTRKRPSPAEMWAGLAPKNMYLWFIKQLYLRVVYSCSLYGHKNLVQNEEVWAVCCKWV